LVDRLFQFDPVQRGTPLRDVLTDGNLIPSPTHELKPIEVPGELAWMVKQAEKLNGLA
jgi:hypothetical protein